MFVEDSARLYLRLAETSFLVCRARSSQTRFHPLLFLFLFFFVSLYAVFAAAKCRINRARAGARAGRVSASAIYRDESQTLTEQKYVCRVV